MKLTLSSVSTRCICLFLFFVVLSSAQAQVTLRQGSIVPIGWNSLSTTNSIRLGVLQDIPAGSVIYFSDWGWNNSSDGFTPTSVSNIGEGEVTWTVASAVPAGTVLLLRLIGSSASPANVSLQNLTTAASLNSNISFSGYTSADPLLTTGDGLFVYQKNALSEIFFISGFNNSAGGTSVVGPDGWNTSIVLAAIDSNLPDGGGSLNALENGVTAIGMTTASTLRNLDNVQYTGPVTATDTSTWRSRLLNIANWSGDNTAAISSTVGSSLSITSPPLPVSLVSFNAVLTENKVSLTWKTASEHNTSAFMIERSSDGQTYNTIGQVQATGGTNGGTYIFSDQVATSSTGLLYYRLRIEDFDDTRAFSSVALVRIQNENSLLITAFPNPLRADNVLRMNISLPSNGQYNIQLVNMAGKVLRSGNYQGLKGNQTLEWTDLHSLPGGTYMLRIGFKNQYQTLKVVK